MLATTHNREREREGATSEPSLSIVGYNNNNRIVVGDDVILFY